LSKRAPSEEISDPSESARGADAGVTIKGRSPGPVGVSRAALERSRALRARKREKSTTLTSVSKWRIGSKNGEGTNKFPRPFQTCQNLGLHYGKARKNGLAAASPPLAPFFVWGGGGGRHPLASKVGQKCHSRVSRPVLPPNRIPYEPRLSRLNFPPTPHVRSSRRGLHFFFVIRPSLSLSVLCLFSFCPTNTMQ
jgi:hypothetical protein